VLRSWSVLLLLSPTASPDEIREQDLFNIAPKRANWDLKREMEKKLAKLDRKTQEAIHTLISTLPVAFERRPWDADDTCCRTKARNSEGRVG